MHLRQQHMGIGAALLLGDCARHVVEQLPRGAKQPDVRRSNRAQMGFAERAHVTEMDKLGNLFTRYSGEQREVTVQKRADPFLEGRYRQGIAHQLVVQ
ncbi:hypothetical protein [Sphingopyxis sp. 113P3]|uniref:hypothetical protein n=1 Tax=Sphingopyxis sp. (strain 113P3) TaxID=292913 RepID=UPI0006AD113B|nr:hypothetical protein [Sphingopyxis sp. 113P3]